MTQFVITGRSHGQVIVTDKQGNVTDFGVSKDRGYVTGISMIPPLNLPTGYGLAAALNSVCHFVDGHHDSDNLPSELDVSVPTAVRNGDESVVYIDESPPIGGNLPVKEECTSYVEGNSGVDTNSGPERPPEVVVKAGFVPMEGKRKHRAGQLMPLGDETLKLVNGKLLVYIRGDMMVLAPLNVRKFSNHPFINQYKSFWTDILYRVLHQAIHHLPKELAEVDREGAAQALLNVDNLYEHPKYPGLGPDLLLTFGRYIPHDNDTQVLKQAENKPILRNISVPWIARAKNRQSLIDQCHNLGIDFEEGERLKILNIPVLENVEVTDTKGNRYLVVSPDFHHEDLNYCFIYGIPAKMPTFSVPSVRD